MRLPSTRSVALHISMAARAKPPLRSRASLLAALIALCAISGARAGQPTSPCEQAASDACYTTFRPAGAQGNVHYYTSRQADTDPSLSAPAHALVALHGHPRDAGKTFQAALLATQRAGRMKDTLVVAPVFQVATDQAHKCRSAGVPPAQNGDLLWTCDSWIAGDPATNDAHFSSFDALDALVRELKAQWPSLQTITVSGFSAGAQAVQHYIGFAAQPQDVALRFVVSDPGTWLYFDNQRPQFSQADNPADATITMAPPPADCPQVNRWKYGTDQLPAHLRKTAAQARQHYAQADIHYLEGALDSSDAPGTFYGIMDKSCAANAQGPYRLQRGLGYAAYDRTLLAPAAQRTVTVVPECAHDVSCVFPSPAAQAALFGGER